MKEGSGSMGGKYEVGRVSGGDTFCFIDVICTSYYVFLGMRGRLRSKLMTRWLHRKFHRIFKLIRDPVLMCFFSVFFGFHESHK